MRVDAAFPFAILLSCAMSANAALAQTEQEHQWCQGTGAISVAQRIEACSSIIKASNEKGEKLAEAFNERGIAYRLKGEPDRAIQDYSQAIKLNSRFAAAYSNRGVAYDRKGDYDRAISDFDQAIKLKPGAELYFNRGNAFLGKNQYDHAIDDFNQALKLRPGFGPALDNRCWARAVVGILKPALADCNEALRRMPGNPAPRETRGFIYLKMTLFDAAVSDFDAALAADPKLPFALYGRGLAKLKNEDHAGEIDLERAKALQADIAEEYQRYGVAGTR